MNFKKIISIVTVLILVSTITCVAQCPMCGESARTSLKEGNTTAAGINTGIFYLLAGPYILMIGGGVLWYRSRKKQHRMEALMGLEK